MRAGWKRAIHLVRLKQDVWKTGSTFALSLCHGFFWGVLLRDFVGYIGFSKGPSMLPTFAEITWHVFRVLSLQQLQKRALRPGDIIVFQNPESEDPRRLLCKRVLYTQNQRGNTVINGQKVTILVPQNHIWVEGDNKGNSCDSRAIGPVSLALVRAKVIATFWPPACINL